MTAAFILGINMAIAAIFAAAFGAVAATNRTAPGAWWLASGYGVGVAYGMLEFVLPGQTDPTPVAIAIFLGFLVVQTLCLVGVSRHYRQAPPWKLAIAVWAASLLATPIVFTLPHDAPLHGLFYQLPYVFMQMLIGIVILRSRRRQPLDILLVALNACAALSYLAKPLIALSVGTARMPQGYLATDYASISQSIGAVTLVAIAMVLLLVIMRDTTAEMTARSETDLLSGLSNRRGFHVHAERAMAQAARWGEPLTLVMADLDHFKAINDSFGHPAGDAVIAHFAKLLRQSAADDAIIGRLGGEEFAVLMLDADLGQARLYAEDVRRRLCAEPLVKLGVDRTVTASFGVAQMAREETLSSLCARTDAALYRAKSGGRDRVKLALNEMTLPLRKSGNLLAG